MNETAVAISSPSLPAVQSSPQQMAVRLRNMGEMVRLTHEFFRDVMVPSTVDSKGVSRVDGDYGVIPGTNKPTLLKPGAEKLCGLYGYAITIDANQTKEIVDYETGFMRVVTTVRLIDKHTGEIAGDGIGECNTKEARYARRWVFANEVPEGLDKRSLKSKEITSKKGGKFTMYMVENDDPFTLWNTVKKMSKKRALVDATLSATCASQLFSQGAEALNDWIEGEFSDLDDEEAEAPAGASGGVPAAKAADGPTSSPSSSSGQTPTAPTPSQLQGVRRIVEEMKQSWGVTSPEFRAMVKEVTEKYGKEKIADYALLSYDEATTLLAYLRQKNGEPPDNGIDADALP